jgi:hypothetical protein
MNARHRIIIRNSALFRFDLYKNFLMKTVQPSTGFTGKKLNFEVYQTQLNTKHEKRTVTDRIECK